jgi:sugar phosphate isomerase/epimerase
MRPGLRLACQEQLLPGDTLQQKWETAQQLGFQAIELRGRGDGHFAARLPELRRAVADGVPIPTVCVDMTYFVGDFDAERRRDAQAQLRSQLSTVAAIGGRLVMTPASYGMFSRRLPPFDPPRSEEEDQAVLVEAFAGLAGHAEAEGVVIGLEPLNRYEDHMVNTLAQAVALCTEVGSPGLGVVADSYHMNIEEADPPASLRAAREHLVHVQVSDSNRLEPGAGHLDWAGWLAALDEIGFGHELTYECRLSGPPEEALAASTAYLRAR